MSDHDFEIGDLVAHKMELEFADLFEPNYGIIVGIKKGDERNYYNVVWASPRIYRDTMQLAKELVLIAKAKNNL